MSLLFVMPFDERAKRDANLELFNHFSKYKKEKKGLQKGFYGGKN